jgi:hypothetical protein
MPRAKTPRITAAEKQIRVDKVMELIAKGLTRRRILQYASEKTDWKVEERAIDHYIQAARAQFVLLSETNRQEEIGLAKAQLADLYEQAQRIQDIKTAAAIRKQRSELLGVVAPKDVRILKTLDERQLIEFAEALTKRGKNPNEAIAALLQELAASDGDELLQ